MIFLNWIIFFSFLFFLGIGLIFFSYKKKKFNLNLAQYGYLFILVSAFGFLSVLSDFEISLFFLVVATGLSWLIYKLFFKTTPKKRQVIKHFIVYNKEFFPILLAVFLLRSFFIEPFQIPSSSMRPGLIPGDFILVNKFTYGLRLPILHKLFLPLGDIKRGDIVVFKEPIHQKVNFIKRVIGIPQDTLLYEDKTLFINGKKISKIPVENYTYLTDEGDQIENNQQFIESIETKAFRTLNNVHKPPFYPQAVQWHPHLKNCQHQKNGRSLRCKIPQGYYFVMGDNRDASNDSRYWGFVKNDLVAGKAFMIWMNFKDFDRIGMMIE